MVRDNGGKEETFLRRYLPGGRKEPDTWGGGKGKTHPASERKKKRSTYPSACDDGKEKIIPPMAKKKTAAIWNGAGKKKGPWQSFKKKKPCRPIAEDAV